jgi:acyl dehydratase
MHTYLHEAGIGDELPPLDLPPITRTSLALFAGASGDYNPMHIDLDFARAAGMPDVFAQGMLPMAYLGRLLTQLAPLSHIREYGVRFTSITRLGDRLRCTARVAERFTADGERRVRVELLAADQNGEAKLTGAAIIALVQ